MIRKQLISIYIKQSQHVHLGNVLTKMECIEIGSQKSLLYPSTVKKRNNAFEASLKRCLSATREEVEETEAAKLVNECTLFSPQLHWHFDVTWQIDDINQGNPLRTRHSSEQFGKQYIVISTHQLNDVDNKMDVFEFPHGSILRLGIQIVIIIIQLCY